MPVIPDTRDHCTPAWATEQDSISQKKKKKKKKQEKTKNHNEMKTLAVSDWPVFTFFKENINQ